MIHALHADNLEPAEFADLKLDTKGLTVPISQLTLYGLRRTVVMLNIYAWCLQEFRICKLLFTDPPSGRNIVVA